ncbi:Peptidyl-prolyl cis-trans isomerase B [Maioricimonas rarisocia]|uniref:peptidylprolyl isomerase n=2 Tax=Maioricimonas rarisocia TaxID=2528026 RepID=A0A517Z331_9PLAN|nr:Peptidyl-prolyl cis-trans isomerase B [Maioricimonas rarisocia]
MLSPRNRVSFELPLCAGILVASISLAVLAPTFATADDAAPAAETGQQASWEELVAAKKSAYARLEEIQKSFGTAQPEEQQKLRQEAGEMIANLRQNVFPKLRVQAPERLKSHPDDVDAAEIVLEISYSENSFAEAARVADMILEQDPTHQLAANLGGISHFAIHDFEGAATILEQARDNKVLVPQLSQVYLDNARKYQEYWQEEQAIRAKEAAATGNDQLPRVVFKTSRGDIEIELFEDDAPNTVANFISLVEKDFYDGIRFHRVIQGFMAQGGCPHSREGDPATPGTGGPGYTIDCEVYEEGARRHFAGSLSMAHAGRDSGGSQFFLTHLPTPHLNRDMNPNGAHTVFGRVVNGMDVVADLEVNDEILSATVTRKRDHEYKPETNPES